ncbi:MAG TPA: histidine kinase dimerization/phosphoacceptor domain-containing protein, partial [Thermomicrobiales bacterium]|nr:histidine kinase dimerization/phosphoacceptor domain-containing protein [Thermomicrobiales bacterium]
MAAGRRMKSAGHGRRSASAESPPSAREDERRRLARDLHDGPAQTLAAALFGVDLAVGALDRAPATARDELFAARA